MHSTPPSHQRQSVSRPYRRSPGGLLLPLHATLAGRVRWQVLDERGVPEVPRTPSGIPVGPVEGVEQPNLITDQGMNDLAVRSCLIFTTGATWRGHLAVGTGSTAPAVSDTTLDNEVQRATTSGASPNGSREFELDTGTNQWRATSLATRLVTMTADRNLTEFGFAPGASDDINIRELIRDGGGTPITVSLLNGKTLRVDHTLTLEMPAPAAGHAVSIDVEEYDAGNNLTATLPYDVIHGGLARDTEAWPDPMEWVWHAWDPTSLSPQTDTATLRRITGDIAYARTGMLGTSDQEPSATGSGIVDFVLATYAAGSFQRVKRATVASAAQDVAWQGYQFSWRRSGANTVARLGGWVVMLDDPKTYTKANTDTLRVGFVGTWARA